MLVDNLSVDTRRTFRSAYLLTGMGQGVRPTSVWSENVTSSPEKGQAAFKDRSARVYRTPAGNQGWRLYARQYTAG